MFLTFSLEDRDLVIQGLVRFAFILFGVGSALGRDIIAEKQWKLGSFILLKLVKRKRQIAPDVIQTLNDRIITGQSVNQYTGDYVVMVVFVFCNLYFLQNVFTF